MTENLDIQRILSLPREPFPGPNLSYLYAKEGYELWPDQSKALYQCWRGRGGLVFIHVGGGKTLVAFLLPIVLSAQRPLLLIPGSMRAQCVADWAYYGRRFYLPPGMRVLSYETLSHKYGEEKLERINPDLIIADEVHMLKSRRRARYRRLKGFLDRNPQTEFVGMSGTLVNRSLLDYAHISSWALKGGTPLPLEKDLLEDWARVLDPKPVPAEDGLEVMAPLLEAFGGDSPREAFARRLRSVPGITIVRSPEVACSLVLHRRHVELPDVIKSVLPDSGEWVSPSEDAVEPSTPALMEEVSRRQLVCGFYYRWVWPDGVPDVEWMEARKQWSRACRHALKKPTRGRDTEGLLAAACEEVFHGKGRMPRYLLGAWARWREQKHKEEPPRATRWVSQYLIDDIIEWVDTQKDPPIIWYGWQAVMHRLSKRTGWTVFGPGKEASEAIIQVSNPVPAIVSLVHGSGKNLQTWGNMLFSTPLSVSSGWEQTLGRCHRAKQKRDEVNATYYRHGPFGKAFETARREALFVNETTTPQNPKLNYATYTDQEDAEWRANQEEIHGDPAGN